MQDMKILLHHFDGNDVEIMLSAFLDDNDFAPEEMQEILQTLQAGKAYWSGGGAAPKWGIEPIGGATAEDAEIQDLRRRAGLNDEV